MMLCSNCDTRNDETARFCRICGTSLVAPAANIAPTRTTPTYTVTNAPMTGPACVTCARTNPPGARFCVYCATPLGVPAVAPTPILQPAYVGVSTNVYVQPVTNIAAPMVLVTANHGNLVLRAVWFFLIGWWLGLLWTIFAWLFNLTLIGLPVGLMMLNAIPTVMTLRPRNVQQIQIAAHGAVVMQRPLQHPLPLRALWFVFVGWWASFVWMMVAWAFSASLILMPISFWMFNRVPTITTLAAE